MSRTNSGRIFFTQVPWHDLQRGGGSAAECGRRKLPHKREPEATWHLHLSLTVSDFPVFPQCGCSVFYTFRSFLFILRLQSFLYNLFSFHFNHLDLNDLNLFKASWLQSRGSVLLQSPPSNFVLCTVLYLADAMTHVEDLSLPVSAHQSLGY